MHLIVFYYHATYAYRVRINFETGTWNDDNIQLRFKYIVIISIGQTPKVHGSISAKVSAIYGNLYGSKRAYISETYPQLPREGSCEEITLVKFKRKFFEKGICILSPLGYINLELQWNIYKELIPCVMMF